jgi:pSer/pThr/pTyr-binding forkhead associated (FHA) protein
MRIKLVVTSGRNAGKEIRIAKSKFIIGRAEDCHLRAHSETVSRHHCVIRTKEGTVSVRDFGSKNGTQLNGVTIDGLQELRDGDILKVGNLEFRVHVETAAAEEKPEPQPEQPAPETIAPHDDLDLDSWLNDTQTVGSDASSDDEATAAPRKDHKANDKSPGLVGVWNKENKKVSAATPRDAAADTLKHFFRRP